MVRCSTRVVALVLFSFLPLSTGCLAPQVKRDGESLRQAVIQLYTDQAMDNLISAYESQPFVQVKYEKISVYDIDTAKASGGVEQTVDETRALAAAALAKFTRVLKNFWTLTGDVSRVRRMSFYANPVTNADDIYEAYVEFAKDPNLFRVTPEKPPCDVHAIKKCHGRYYWVPVEAGFAYQTLLLRTAFMRGEERIVGYRERTCVGLRHIEKLIDEKQTYLGDRFWIDFDAPVPNDISTLVVVLPDGRKYKQEALKDANNKEGALVSSLEVQLTPDSPLREYLIGSLVRVYSNHYPPEASGSYRSSQQVDVNPVERSLERIRQAQ